MIQQQIPVLIVGGGLVGLSTALFLSHQNIDYRLIERHKGTSIHPKARGINTRSMELFRPFQIEEQIRAAGAALGKGGGGLLQANTLLEADFSTMKDLIQKLVAENEQLSPTRGSFTTQDLMEPILLQAIQERQAHIQFNMELVSFTQDEQGVSAIIQNRETGTHETIYAQYLIAADGANSRIRQALGIQMSGRGTLSYNMNMYFRANLKPYVEGREFSICNINHPEATGTLISINNDDLWTFHVNFDPTKGESLNDFPDDRCIQLIHKAVGNPELDVEIISILPWEAAVKVADRFQVGRIFLVGDAAHLMPPTGGFGGNSGIADGHNLAWKLAAVLKGMAAPELLSTYEIERKAVSHFTTEQAGLIANTGQLNMVSKKESEAPVTSNNHVIMRYQYRSSAVIAEHFDSESSLSPYVELLDGKPGTRAPHLWLEQNGRLISTIDLFNKNFVLLADEHSTWIHTAQYVSGELNNLPIDMFTIGQTGSFQDHENQWHKIYRIPAGGAVLIRPDGFVAWRSGQVENPTETLSSVMKQLLSFKK
ncbi:4-methyl-5-nitrocatechol 5-monooxygenase [Paenibacillus solanacearum]|uniref:4-methyl-5-nitrocatechol 5-monooxygenase n=1 Tax=Paenibacillus solanacearum TaxID=2048548 RepID=A0A916K9E2_9BACL|nr:FAD-dependent monooxygenase [Paenibacillus solanacearum]CAG7647944.1 4-methyl-5-nitrocatechol 5-monooxygenase [Paenibacillus solanacearum]